MELRIFVEPQQGASYADQLAMARKAEECGFGAFFRSDHYLVIGGSDGLPGPTDSWVTLAGLARETSRIRLGTLVTAGTFRLPGVLAIQVAQVDEMSGGRVELGLGAGWFEAEHTAYGIPFPDVGTRFDRFEEQLEIITGIWGTPVGETFSYAGSQYTLQDCPALPKPTQHPLPLVVGGGGKRRTPALAARFASDFNVGDCTAESISLAYDRVRVECERIRRDPAEITCSVVLLTTVGVDTAQVARRLGVFGGDAQELATVGLVGSPAEVVDRLGRYREHGARRAYLQIRDLADLDHLELIAAQVLPQVAAAD
jgi:F420-dependent oxidoreductase-like protein